MNKIYLVEGSSSGIGLSDEEPFEVRHTSLGVDYAYMIKEDSIVVLNKVEYVCNKGDIFLKMYSFYSNGVRGPQYGIVLKSEELFNDMEAREREYEIKYSKNLDNDQCVDCELAASF